MKDTVITGSQKKRELLTLLVCFAAAIIANVYAIIKYSSPWSELFSSIFYVLILTVVFYVLWTILRLIYYGIKSLSGVFRKDKKNIKQKIQL